MGEAGENWVSTVTLSVLPDALMAQKFSSHLSPRWWVPNNRFLACTESSLAGSGLSSPNARSAALSAAVPITPGHHTAQESEISHPQPLGHFHAQSGVSQNENETFLSMNPFGFGSLVLSGTHSVAQTAISRATSTPSDLGLQSAIKSACHHS